MNETNVDWNDPQLFLAVARDGGLSLAARKTGRSPATLGRRMLALEQAMGRELFVRHERGYALTAAAEELLGQLKDVEARLLRVSERAERDERPLVKISAGTWTTLAILRHFDQITGAPADVRLRFLSTETVLDIPRREAVIGFRNRRPSEEGLAARKLSRVEFAPYACPGAPDRWIKVLADTPSARWLEKRVDKDAVCEVSSPRNSLDLALAGRGVAILPTFVGDSETGLQRTGATIPDLAHDRWMVTHQDDRNRPEVRRTIDRLCDVMGQGG